MTLKRLTPLLLILLFAALAILGNPYLFDEGNSGRYLVGVLREMDPTLFSVDPVADSLARFRSIFYDGLGWVFGGLGLAPEQLRPAMFWLYGLVKVLTFAALFFVVGKLTDDRWAFVLLAAWAVHVKQTPLGSTQIFAPILRHSEVVLLIELVGLYFLFGRRWLFFWLCASFALFVHSVLGLQFFWSVALPLLWLERREWRALLPGLAIFVIAALVYQFFMAPPHFNAQEAAIFLQAKANSEHVSFLHEQLFNWLDLLTLLPLAGLTFWYLLRREPNYQLLAGAMASGTVIGLGLSVAAVVTRIVPLVQIQPLRTFVWITLFAHLLLAAGAATSLKHKPLLGAMLVAYLGASIQNFAWAFAFGGLGVIYLAALVAGRPRPERLERLAQLALYGLTGLMLLAGLSGRWLPDSLGDITVIIPAGITLLLTYLLTRQAKWQAILAALLGITLLLTSVSYFRRWSALQNGDWAAVCQWASQNTNHDDLFLLTPQKTFRTCAFRTAIANDYSALAWVDPFTFQEQKGYDQQIQAAYEAGEWQISQLLALASQQQIQYIVVGDSYQSDLPVVFRSGRYIVLKVAD